MARYTGPKNKLSRKVGEDLGLKSNAIKTSRRLMIRPGQHGTKGRRKMSDFGVQLKEKQKVKFIYGILEKQLSQLYVLASRNPASTGSILLSLLERRLDNVIYRAGWTATRAAARQLVAHGHVLVNGKKLTSPSYRVEVEDVVSLRPASTNIPTVAERLKDLKVSGEWLEVKGAGLKISRYPERKDIQENINEQLIVEYYSR